MKSVLVIGASRGIGQELVHQYLQSGAHVVATARSEAALAALREAGAVAIHLDVLDAASASGLGAQIEGAQFDAVFVNAGVFGPRYAGMTPPSQDEFDNVMQTNVLGPMRVLPQLQAALASDARVAVLSSRMGSLALRTDDSAWLYRASKAALNSVLKTASFAFAGRATCVALHPGWVRTDTGGSGADLSVTESAACLRGVVAGLTATDNGSFFNVDGTRLAW